jgi:hypothetical protein
VTTYQTGKLVVVRVQEGALNTHYCSFQAPMRLALSRSAEGLAIRTTIQLWEFRDVPAVAARLEPKGTHHACYLPRPSHSTGNVQIHEMVYREGASQAETSNTFSQTVSSASTALTLTSTMSDIVNIRTKVTFAAAVTDTWMLPASQVQFWDGSTLLTTVTLNA